MSGSDGYPYHPILYQGKEAMRSKDPLGIQVVGNMIKVVEQASETTRYELFFENFFTSHDLKQKLASQLMRASEQSEKIESTQQPRQCTHIRS